MSDREREPATGVGAPDVVRARLGSVVGRISAGFVAVVVLHAVVVVMSHVGLERAATNAEEARRHEAEMTRVLQTDRRIAALQRDVLAFIDSGDEVLAERVRASAADLEGSLSRAARGSALDEGRAELDRMVAALHAYRDDFERVVEDRGQRELVMRDSVLPIVSGIRGSLDRVIREAVTLGDDELAAAASACLHSIDGADSSVLRYLIDPSGEPVRDFQRGVVTSAERIDGLDVARLSPATSAELATAAAQLAAWEDAVLRVVNSTRSYLHLVNVVLAGGALEFRTLSTRFTEGSLERRARFDAELAGSRARFRTIADAVGLLTVLAGLIAGWLISRSVSRPITALTGTLSGLAAGRDERIAGTERRDEIGEMARAAEVFAARNRETKELLTRSKEDTARQERLNAELEHHVAELERRNDDLDSFSYSASHDLRAPLRSIALLATWIQEDAGEALSSESLEHLDTLRRRVARLDGLLDGLLEYSRTGRTADLSEPLPLLDVVRETVASITDDPAVRAHVDGEDVTVQAPRVAIEKVVQNLVSNAIHHHHRADPRIDVRVERERDLAVIRVTDDGPGISPDLHGKVFQIFQTGRRRDEHESSGIGLALVQKLCRAHGAEVRLESDGRSGSTFEVRWPVQARRAWDARKEAGAGLVGAGEEVASPTPRRYHFPREESASERTDRTRDDSAAPA